MKITLVGDIMIEPPVLKAARQKDGSYDFSGVFAKVKPMLAESDYVHHFLYGDGHLTVGIGSPEPGNIAEHKAQECGDHADK